MSLLSEYGEFLRTHKRYWLLPLVLILAALALVILASDNADVAPLIYAGDGGR